MREKSWEEKMAIKVGKKIMKKKKKSDKFVWWKKIERDVGLGKLNVKSEKKERIAEMEKLKKRRNERVVEKARREEEMMLLQRERVRADADVLEKKECEFIIDQFKAKSMIRFLQGRIQPIDIVTLNYDYNHNPNALSLGNLELEEPCLIFKGLTVRDMEELRGEIKLRLDCLRTIGDDGIQFWEALMVVCDWELGQCTSGFHPSIETDVMSFLQGIQSYDELIALEARIESDMRVGKSKVVEFWEGVLGHIHVYKAKAFLKAFHRPHKLSEPKLIVSDDRREDLDMEEGEWVLGCSAEVKLDSKWNWWHDIYKPRKPKYVIKYHTGYVWNQYNRTHYDKQNPPPNFIQGYKFNIFYPHLIDHTKTPECFIDADADADTDTDTCVLRFHAGPPYEDIAFRIPNKDWECSRKKGFKCTFEALRIRSCGRLSELKAVVEAKNLISGMEKSKDGSNFSTDHISHGFASSSGENKINIRNPRDAEVSTVSSERFYSAQQTSIRSDLSSEIREPFNGKRKELDSVTAAVSHEYLTTKTTDHNKLLKTDSTSSKDSGEVVQLSSVDSTDPIPYQSFDETLVEKKPCVIAQSVQSKIVFQDRESSFSTRSDATAASHFTFDLNEEIEANGAISVVAKVGVPMGLPRKLLQFDGELGWKRSGVSSAFRPTSFKNPERKKGTLCNRSFDLNVAATMDSELADETSTPERCILDLNSRSEYNGKYHKPGLSSLDLNYNPMIEDTCKNLYHNQQSENQQLIRKGVAVDTRVGNANQFVFDNRRPSSYWVNLSSMRGYSQVQPNSFLVAAPTPEQVQMVVPSGVYIGKISNLSPTFYLNNQPAISQIPGSVLAAYPGPLHLLEGPHGLNMNPNPRAYANMRPAFFPNGSIPLMENGNRGVSNPELLIPIPVRNGLFEARVKPIEQAASQISYRQMASWN